MEKSNQRISKLDGLRGLLSLVVTLNHSFLVLAIPAFANVWGQNVLEFHDWQSKIQQIMMILGNGGAAVTLFFILSGFVMGLSLNKFSKIGLLDTINFYIKRIIRLYPVYLFLVVVTAIYMWTIFVYKVYPSASTWYTWWMNFQMTVNEFFLNVFFIHTYLGGVTWTLRVILIASIIFPIFYLINRRTSKLVDLLLVILLIVLDFTIFNIPNFRDLRYLFMFYSGLIIAKFSKFFNSIPGWLIYVTSPFVIFLLLDIRYMTGEYTGGVVENIICWFIIGLLAYGQELR
ncbi:MAG TPA: acyltransferase family protein, partial [Patescibacteria group bacterium]